MNKVSIFRSFCEYGLFEILEEIMISQASHFNVSTDSNNNEPQNRENIQYKDGEINASQHLRLIIEILILSLIQAPRLLREYCVSEGQQTLQYPFLTYLCNETIYNPDSTIQNMVRY